MALLPIKGLLKKDNNFVFVCLFPVQFALVWCRRRRRKRRRRRNQSRVSALRWLANHPTPWVSSNFSYPTGCPVTMVTFGHGDTCCSRNIAIFNFKAKCWFQHWIPSSNKFFAAQVIFGRRIATLSKLGSPCSSWQRARIYKQGAWTSDEDPYLFSSRPVWFVSHGVQLALFLFDNLCLPRGLFADDAREEVRFESLQQCRQYCTRYVSEREKWCAQNQSARDGTREMRRELSKEDMFFQSGQSLAVKMTTGNGLFDGNLAELRLDVFGNVMFLKAPHWSDVSPQFTHGFPRRLILAHHRGVLRQHHWRHGFQPPNPSSSRQKIRSDQYEKVIFS